MTFGPYTEEQIAAAEYYARQHPPADIDPRIEKLVIDLIGRVADKWTMLILEVLTEKGELRFTRLAEAVEGVSQKMLTQTCARWSATGLFSGRCIPSCRRGSNIS